MNYCAFESPAHLFITVGVDGAVWVIRKTSETSRRWIVLSYKIHKKLLFRLYQSPTQKHW